MGVLRLPLTSIITACGQCDEPTITDNVSAHCGYLMLAAVNIMNHGIHKYKGGEFEEYFGEEIEVQDNHDDPNAQCYEIRFVSENMWHDNMHDDDIEWQS